MKVRQWVQAWLESLSHYTIMNPGEDGQLVGYLTRYHLLRLFGFKLCLHHALRSDGDRELHGHPWFWAGIIVVGGYWEHRLSGVYRRRPGQLLLVGRAKLHRLELPAGKTSWSLILMFPRLNHSWCFLQAGKLIPWVNFLRQKGIPLGKLD